MYHELILALNGYPGDVFEFDGESYQVSRNLQIPLFHPSELAVVKEILEVATLYKNISDFLDSRERLSNLVIHENHDEVGLYLSSVCNGIRDLLNVYLEMIASLELRILNDAYLSLTSVRLETEPYRTLFVALQGIINTVRKQKSSTVIVELVKAEYESHIHLQAHLKMLIPWLNRTLFRQITNWIVFGTLVDPFDEFFVQRKKKLNDDDNDEYDVVVEDKDSYSSDDYLVNYSLVPAHFSVSMVEKILFIGNSVAILKNSDRTKQDILAKQNLFSENMKSLPTDNFRTEELVETIDFIALSVGKDMHHLVLTETDLPKHLGIIKDFYLTGRGELFHDFLLNLSNMPSSSGRCLVLTDIQNAFRLAAVRVQVQEEVLQNIEVTLDKIPPDANKTLLAQITYINLNLKLQWPLQILFSELSMKEYNALMQFFLQVRLIQLELNTVWVNTRKVFRFPIKKGPADLKNSMSFFIDHLQYYLQADVLESQYCILMNTISKSENFDQIRLAHASFQSNILAQSFHTNKKVKHFLMQLLNVCTDFITFMKKHIEECEEKNLPINEGVSKEVLKFSTDFRNYMDLLLSLLKGLAVNPQSGQYLSQFLLRLDFNSYYTKLTGI